MTSTNTTDYPKTFDVTGALDVSIELGSGDVSVTAAGDSEAVVTLRPGRAGDRDALDLIARSRVDLRGSSLRIDVPRTIGFRSHPDIVVEVTVPTNSTVAVKVGSADVRLDGSFGDTAITTGSGDVWVGSCGDAKVGTGSGDVRLGQVGSVSGKTGSGDIVIARAAGSVKLGSGSGDIRVDELGADAELSTASGDIEVGAMAEDVSVMQSVRASTASGDIAMKRAVAGELEFKAASGNVTVGVVDGTATLLDCSSVTGRVRSELTPSGAPDDGNDRRLFVKARSVSGAINIRKSY
jgi:DUF4097 and DUF4098 domain-containing protein YvlB